MGLHAQVCRRNLHVAQRNWVWPAWKACALPGARMSQMQDARKVEKCTDGVAEGRQRLIGGSPWFHLFFSWITLCSLFVCLLVVLYRIWSQYYRSDIRELVCHKLC